jgi:chemotaxis protein methyltransferase CheR
MSDTGNDDALLGQLIDLASRRTGFRPDAIRPQAVHRALQTLLAAGLARDQILKRALAGERMVVTTICESVSVGETYFFRHPEHFELVARILGAAPARARPHGYRAWCAGCATGEEAYSLAAFLHAQLGGRANPLAVIGSDLSSRSIAAAERGVYRPWSRREAGPLLHPVVEERPDGSLEVLPSVRRLATFRVHNLLDAPLPGPFDLIFCRNVLIYFDQAAITGVVARLASVLAPDGLLVLGTMDLAAPGPELVRLGPDGLNVFSLRPRTPPAARPSAPVRIATPPPVTVPEPPRPIDPVAEHLRALTFIETGHPQDAAVVLAAIQRAAPEYLPGLLERALLHQRAGETGAARHLVREVLARTEGLPADHPVAGPEVLPISYYRTSAMTMLAGAPEGWR